jgi:hypothetical protein
VRDEDDLRDTPPMVVGAVAAGTAPVPFLAVYSVMFIVHGGFHPVVPPDITSTAHGELIAGIITLGLLIIAVTTLLWLLNGRRRWPFALVQLAVLATAIDFVIDDTKSGRGLSLVLALTSLVALVLAFTKQGWEHMGLSGPKRRRRRAMPAGSAPGPDAVPTSARSVGRRSHSTDSSSV